MKKNNKNGQKLLPIAIRLVPMAILLSSCAATQTAIEHRNLEASTRLSESIFLSPVSDTEKSIYISLKNTSGESISIEQPLKAELRAKGYKIVNHANSAHYWLQANVLKIAKMSKAASQNMLGGGVGSTLAGAGTGAFLGSMTGNSNTAIAGGLAGGLAGFAADSLVSAVNYTMVTDVQISERVGRGVKVKESFDSALQNGVASGTTQHSSSLSQYQRYRTRIVSNADRVNLSLAKARPVLETGLVKTLAGIF